MTLYFPDVNVWLTLSDEANAHADRAWEWLNSIPYDDRLIFCRFTQLGLLRLLTNEAVMGAQRLTLRQAWNAYDELAANLPAELAAEPPGIDAAFRRASDSFGARSATKVIGDCYLLAFAQVADATLVTFDRALHDYAAKQGCPAVIPS